MALGISRRQVLQGGSATLLSGCTAANAGSTPPVSAFLDGIGVNTHLSSKAYTERIEIVENAVRTAGIRHVRDEIRPTDNLQLRRLLCSRCGIRFHLLVSPVTNTASQMLSYVQRLGAENVSVIEGQNEGDSDWFKAQPQARNDWSSTVVAYQREIFQMLRARFKSDVLPIASPTVLNWKPGDMLLIRPAADFSDIVAIHAYVQHGEEPETKADYSAISWYVRNMRNAFKPDGPIMVTEAGYNTMTRPGGTGVSENAAAIYIPRMLLNNFANGIQRTFLYQLLDGGSDPGEWEHHFGLLRHDNSPKPAYDALVSLVGGMAVDDWQPSRDDELRLLHVESVPPSEIRYLAFKQRSGALVVAIWRAVSCWDVASATDIVVEPQPVTIGLSRPASRVAMLVVGSGHGWSWLSSPASKIELRLAATVVLLKVV